MTISTTVLRGAAVSGALAFALTACGGGGAGGGSLPAAGSAPASTTTSPQAQQAATMAAAQEVRAKAWAAKYVGSASAPTQFRKTAHDFARHVPLSRKIASTTTACNGPESTGVVQNSDGSITITQIGYYDNACTTLMYQASNTLSAPDSTGKILGKGTETDYATDGKTVAEYDVLNTIIYNANFGSGDMVMSIARYKDAASAAVSNAIPLDTDYFSSLDTAANAQSVGAASIQPDPSFPGGQVGDVSNYATTYTGGLFQTNLSTKVTGTTTNVKDNAGHLSVAFPLAAGQYQWVITGGSVVSTVTETETSTEDTAGTLLAYNDVVVDSANDITTTITSTNGTQYNGTLKQTSTGTTLATFVVDQDGNGTITFANGTTLPVHFWCWGS